MNTLLQTNPFAVRLKTPGPDFLHLVDASYPAPDVVVLPDGGRLSIEVYAHVAESDAVAEAQAAAAKLTDAIAASVDEAVSQSAERAAAGQASLAFDEAMVELTAARSREKAARDEYAAAVAAGIDPRPYRPAVTAANQEVEDLTGWVDALHAKHQAASSAVAALASRLWALGCTSLADTMAAKRVALRAKVQRTVSGLAAELLAIDAADRALKSPRPTRSTPPARPREVEDVLLDGDEADDRPIEEQILNAA